MRLRPMIAVACLVPLLATASYASFGGGPKNDPPPSTPPSSPDATEGQSVTSRQEAERLYADGYEQVAKAKKDIADGKAKNATKKFKRALERGESAVALDANYYEAWNLVGYASRKLGDYPKAFAAYEKCLAIKADYAPAREYLGEAWLEQNDPTKARLQLAELEKSGATAEATDLRTQIEAFEKAHPGTAPAAPTATAPAAAPAATDTTSASSDH